MAFRPRANPLHLGIFAALLLLLWPLLAASARAQCPTLPPEQSFPGDTDFQTVKSQMWYNDGTWWGAFSDGSTGVYIYRKTGNTFTQENLITSNPIAQPDVIWDGTNLFIMSYESGSLAKFYKYSYNGAHTLLPSFPINLPLIGMATHVVIAKDSTGKLWATYTGAGNGLGGDGSVHVIWTTSADHRFWDSTGFILDTGLTPFTTEVSAIIAFGGNKIGVGWSDQADGELYFRVHVDGTGETVWQARETVDGGQGIPGIADDHMSVQTAPDGRVFLVAKDGVGKGGINFYVRGAAGGWSPRVQVNTVPGAQPTRPVLLMDIESQVLYVIYRDTSVEQILISRTTMANPTVFGPPCPFIFTSNSNNPTSTKQPLNLTTDLMAVSSQDGQIKFQTLDLSLPPTASFTTSTTSGNAPLNVNFTDTSTDDVGIASWNWNFGDGYTSTLQNPSHVFGPGMHTVTLQAVDASGNASTAQTVINVTDVDVPVVQNLSPLKVVLNSGAFTLTVDGADFVAGSIVRFNGSNRTTTFVNTNRLTASMPASDAATLGQFPITVIRPNTNVSNAVNLTVTADAPLPILTSISPTEVTAGSPDVLLTATGSSFTSTSQIHFNNTARATTFVNSTTLRTTIPAAELTSAQYNIPVYVVTPAPGGGQTATRFFIVRPICGPTNPSYSFAGTTEFNTIKAQMWYNDRTWWGAFSDIDGSGAGSGISVYKKSGTAFNKGQVIDSNGIGIPDVLWDGTHLYVMVLHNGSLAKFYKFTYSSATQTYALLPGFPINIPLTGLAASIHFDKDSTGKLWATYTGTFVDEGIGDREVHVIWTTNAAHTAWNTTGVVLASNLSALTTEVSGVIPFGGNKIGILWSNQAVPEFGFRVHNDADPETVWSAKEVIDSGVQRVDDHISMQATPDGRVLAALKDGIGFGHVNFYRRSTSGVWSPRMNVNLDPNSQATRQVLLYDETNQEVWVIHKDSANLTSAFYSRMHVDGTGFTPPCPYVNQPLSNPTSTKQYINSVTDLYTAGRTGGSVHIANLDIAGPGGPSGPVITSLSPAIVVKGGAAFTLTVNGTGFVSGATVSINGQNRTTTFVNTTQLTAQILASDIVNGGFVPVRVSNPGGGSGNPSPGFDLAINNPFPNINVTGGLSPDNALAGGPDFTITVNGINFVNGSTVRWNGSARVTTFVSPTQLTATITAADIANSGANQITVHNPAPGGGTSSQRAFSVSNPVPGLTSLSPNTAAAGGQTFIMSVTGSNFVNGSIVRFNGINRITTFVSSTELTAQIPSSDIATVGTFPVTVFNPAPGGGASGPVNFSVTNEPPRPVPTLTSISPTSVASGGPAFTLTANGADFASNAVVRFNGIDRTTTFVSSTQLTAQILASDIATGGSYPITVFNPAPGGGVSTAINLSVTNPVPVINAIQPPSKDVGASASLKALGSNFVNGSVIRFNGSNRPTAFISSTEIEAQLTIADVSTAGVYPITVFNPAPGGGVTATSVNLTVTNHVPTITTISPNVKNAGDPAFTLTVNGTNFVNGSVVRVNGTDRTTTLVSSTQLTANVLAADIATGGTVPITVFNPAPGGGTSNSVNLTVNNSPPTITTLSPSSATAGGAAFTLTVNGTNFANGAVVSFNGVDRTTTFVNSTQLTASILAADIASAGTFPVVVTNPAPGGGASTPVNFTVNNPAPTITTLSPTSATAGGAAFTLTVNGTNFVASSGVLVNGSARTTTFVNSTQLTASIPATDIATAGTLQVTVFNPTPGGGTSAPSNFTVNNPVPTITTLSPSSATAGGAAFTLTVNGTNFVSGSVVRWNGVNRTTTFVNSTQLTASITAADIATAGTFPVTVFNPTPGGGASAPSNFNVNNPVPAITTLSPPSALAGGAAFTLTVNGTNFVNGSVVRWNGVARTTTFVNSTQLTASISAADIATPATVPVTVFNPTPGGGTSAPVNFEVTSAPVPTVTTISPNVKNAGDPAFTLTVNGTNFVSNSVVRFNGTDRATTFVSSTQLTASILAADTATGGTFPITVFNPAPGGGTSNSVNLTVNNPAPTVTTLSPTSATAGGAAFTLTVNGTNFVNGSVVRWNGVAKTTTFVNSTQLTASIPATDIATAGTIPVTVFNPTPGGGASTPVNFTVNNPAPTITTLSPTSATAGGAAFTLTVNGTNFVNGSGVLVNGSARTTTFVNSTQLTASIPATDIATAGTLQVTVFNPTPGGGTSAPSNFTVNNPVPTITTLSPTSATAGGAAFTLTVNGTNFVNGSVVRWNGVARTTTFVNSTQLTASITAADIATAGTFPVTVFNPTPGGGASAPVNFEVNQQNQVPTVNTLSPSSVALNSGAQTLTVNGTNFVNGSEVRFNGSARTTTFVSSSQLTAQLTAADAQTAGTFPITVFNPAPGGGTSTPVNFSVNNPTPLVNTISPTSATAGDAAFTLTVNGSGFVNGAVVSFGGTNLVTAFVSDTQLTAQAGSAQIATAGSRQVVVDNPAPGGGPSNAVNFTVNNPAPTIGLISPPSVPEGSAAFILTVNGANFVNGSVVRWNGSARTTTFVNATRITAQITAADVAAQGTANVTVFNSAPGGGETPAQTFNITVNNRVVRAAAASGAPAGTVAVPIQLDSQGDENSLSFSLTFDTSLLSNPQVALGADAGGALLTSNNTEVGIGRIGVNLALPPAQVFAQGTREAVVVTFTTASVAVLTNTQVAFGDQPVARLVVNANATPLPSSYSPGTVTISPGYEGDVAPRPNGSNNGSVTIADWVQCGRFSAGLDSPNPGGEYQRADTAPRSSLGNGQISISDWVQCGRYSAGLDPVVLAGGPTSPSTAAPVSAKLSVGASTLQNAAAPRTVRLVVDDIAAGQSGTVFVELDAQGGENALGLSLEFDPAALSFVKAEKGTDAAAATLNVNETKLKDGKLGIALALPTNESFAAGARRVAALTFAAAPNASGVTTLNFGDAPIFRELVDVTADVLAVEFKPVELRIVGGGGAVIEFASATSTVSEGESAVRLEVKRTGDAASESAVDYTTGDATASQRGDYIYTAGTLRFAPGETSKTLSVILSDDAHVEGAENFSVSLSGASGGQLGSKTKSTVTISDNDLIADVNPLDAAGFFVRQHYADFLNREPDAAGLNFWAAQIDSCGGDAACILDKRVNVSAAFFLSIEFQQTGYLVYRLYTASFPDSAARPRGLPRYREFLRDSQSMSEGVVVNVGDWQGRIEANKRAFIDEFVKRDEFAALYPATLTPRQFVEKLSAQAGPSLTSDERDQLITALSSGAKTRAEVLRAVAEDAEWSAAQSNPAFVLMQYFGYLRRNPYEQPDDNFAGHDFWLSKLDAHNGNFVSAEMVKAFILSGEYRRRFGP